MILLYIIIGIGLLLGIAFLVGAIAIFRAVARLEAQARGEQTPVKSGKAEIIMPNQVKAKFDSGTVKNMGDIIT